MEKSKSTQKEQKIVQELQPYTIAKITLTEEKSIIIAKINLPDFCFASEPILLEPGKGNDLLVFHHFKRISESPLDLWISTMGKTLIFSNISLKNIEERILNFLNLTPLIEKGKVVEIEGFTVYMKVGNPSMLFVFSKG